MLRNSGDFVYVEQITSMYIELHNFQVRILNFSKVGRRSTRKPLTISKQNIVLPFWNDSCDPCDDRQVASCSTRIGPLGCKSNVSSSEPMHDYLHWLPFPEVWSLNRQFKLFAYVSAPRHLSAYQSACSYRWHPAIRLCLHAIL